MKEFKMSTKSERITGVIFSAVMIAAMIAMLVSLRENITLMLVCAVGVLCISTLLVMYVRGVLRAAVFVNAETKELRVQGMQDYTLDLKNATMVQTFSRKIAQSNVRLLVFSDADDEIIAMVQTMFTFKGGIWADPVAKEIAAEMGIAFKQTVPDWQLDKEKYKEHVKEEDARQKQEAKERRQKKMAARIQKRKNQLK